MLQNKYDVVVVGGGPAGSMAAWEAAKGGVSVCMLEKDRDIGYPVRCGEAAGESGLRQFVEIEDSWIAEKITSVKLVSPNLTSVDIDFAAETGYILNRRIFDYDLSRYAANAGAEVYTKAYVKNVLANNGEVNGVVLDYLGEEKQIQAKIVIGADGLTSRVGRWAGLKTLVRMKDMESAVQYS
ncbi:MAG TPA: NAD(P)/FAD-dependent oxidoreductase, partial [Candidatus Marinimicrobia bacterium]|nr:NAD(P)/FAD-dependent oxidoreductase [Candidatus Neomarinimicrobiota bacterium]